MSVLLWCTSVVQIDVMHAVQGLHRKGRALLTLCG